MSRWPLGLGIACTGSAVAVGRNGVTVAIDFGNFAFHPVFVNFFHQRFDFLQSMRLHDVGAGSQEVGVPDVVRVV